MLVRSKKLVTNKKIFGRTKKISAEVLEKPKLYGWAGRYADWIEKALSSAVARANEVGGALAKSGGH